MRLIDADAISYESIDSCDTGRHEHYYGTGIVAVRKEDIDAMPTIQPNRGTWIDKGWTGDWQYLTDGRGDCWRNIVCSECGESVRHESNFCPNCGVKMEVTE